MHRSYQWISDAWSHAASRDQSTRGDGMRLLILSDLHREIWYREQTHHEVQVDHFPTIDPAVSRPDVVVLAGDIDTGDRAVAWARTEFETLPVLYIRPYAKPRLVPGVFAFLLPRWQSHVAARSCWSSSRGGRVPLKGSLSSPRLVRPRLGRSQSRPMRVLSSLPRTTRGGLGSGTFGREVDLPRASWQGPRQT